MALTQVRPTQPKMSLASVRRGKRRAPDRILVVGVEGVGKSTFAAGAPSPIFLATEDGINQLDVPSFPEPHTFQEVLDALDVLTNDEHEFKTLVIDTIDWLESLIWRDVCASNRWDNIEAPGYGKGYNVALEGWWRRLVNKLAILREKRGMEIILLAHAAIRPFANPNGADFSRYECKLHKGASALIREWCDTNLFATHEEFTRKDGGRVKGVSSGRRIVKTERAAGYDAKNRWNLPPELPLSYEDYAAAREAGFTVGSNADPAELFAEATRLVEQLAPPPEQREVMTTYNEKHKNNAAVLTQVVNRLRSLIAEKEA